MSQEAEITVRCLYHEIGAKRKDEDLDGSRMKPINQDQMNREGESRTEQLQRQETWRVHLIRLNLEEADSGKELDVDMKQQAEHN